MDNPDVRKRLSGGWVEIVVGKSSVDFDEFVKSETNRFGAVIKQANIVVD